MIQEKILNNLEYDKIMAIVSSYVMLKGTKERMLEIRPAESYEEAVEQLNFTSEADRVLYFYMRSPLTSFEPLDDTLVKASKMSLLSFSELKKVSKLLRSSRIFKDSIESLNDEELPQMNYLASLLYEDRKFEEEIESTFISDEEISDRASPELYAIRKKIRRLNTEIKDRLGSLVRSKEMQKMMQDNIVTSREGRYVIPVKIECKGQVKGLIHDYSASGNTIYVEPIEIVETNNELRMSYVDEQAEIGRILERFTRKVGTMAEGLTMAEKQLIEADVVLAKAKYGRHARAIKPILKTDGSFKIVQGRHPLLNTKIVVPVSVEIDKDSSFILISGPNTGGKTVTLKMTGLFALMAMSGLYLPSKEDTTISFYNEIFSDIGDEQSIEQNLSTFSSHIVTLKNIVENVTDKSLVLLDEIGAGTDPQEGSALALAIMEHLLNSGCKGIITTHYGELKEYSYTTDKIVNASMEFDMNNLSPTYRLNMGIPGSSKALEISQRLGLPQHIIDLAKTKISPLKQSFESVLASADRERIEAENLKNKYLSTLQQLQLELEEVKKEKDKLFIEKENITKVAKIEAKRIVSEASFEAEELLSEIKGIYNSDSGIGGKEVIEASKLKNKLSSLSDAKEENFTEIEYEEFHFDNAKVGQKVFVVSLSTVCEIIAINKRRKECTVQYGNMKLDAKPNNIKGLTAKYLKYYNEQNKQVTPKKKNVIKTNNVKLDNKVELELNVVGKRAFDAITDVNAFIDRAYRSGSTTVKIIHGVGTMVLKKAVAEELKKKKVVKSFRAGAYGEGDIGVTIVELKK